MVFPPDNPLPSVLMWPAVERRDRVRHEIQREQPPCAKRQMLGDVKVAHRAKRQLADAIGRPLLDVGKLAVLRHFSEPEQGPAGMLHRRFADVGVIVVAVRALAAPRERSRELPPRCNLTRVERAWRPAFLVDPRFELLGIGEMTPASLQRERARRVPRHPDRSRIEWTGLDVPAVLVGLAAVEQAHLEFYPIQRQAGGHDSAPDYARIAPIVADPATQPSQRRLATPACRSAKTQP